MGSNNNNDNMEPEEEGEPNPDELILDLNGGNDDFEIIEDMDEGGLNDEPIDDESDDDDDGGAYHMDDEDEEDDEEEEEVAPQLPDDSLFVFKSHTGSVHALDDHPSTDLVVSGGEDDMAYVWRYGNHTQVHKLEGHTDTVVSACFSFDGSLIATASLDSSVRIWNTESGALLHTKDDLGDGIEWLISHPKGNVFIAGGCDGRSAMWNGNGDCMQIFLGHADRVTCGALSLDGKLLITGSADCTLKVFNPKTALCLHTYDKMKNLPDAEVTCLTPCLTNAEIFIIGFADGSVALIGITSGKFLNKFQQHSQAVECVACCKTQPLFASCGFDGIVCVYDLSSQSMRSKLVVGCGVIKICFSQEKLIFCGSDGRLMVLRDCRANLTAEDIRVLGGHSKMILNFTVAHSGGHLLSASDDHTVRVFAMP